MSDFPLYLIFLLANLVEEKARILEPNERQRKIGKHSKFLKKKKSHAKKNIFNQWKLWTRWAGNFVWMRSFHGNVPRKSGQWSLVKHRKIKNLVLVISTKRGEKSADCLAGNYCLLYNSHQVNCPFEKKSWHLWLYFNDVGKDTFNEWLLVGRISFTLSLLE